MKLPLVTVVVSTYNRPTILKSALESVIYQNFDLWQVFVIGDNCSEETADMISKLNHPKIKYHNNPLRYGEQSGCNNIGMALSKTKYIALLNHDDVWTPDHLEKAIEYLESNDSDFYVANSIFTKRVDETGFPILKSVYQQRRLIKVFTSSHVYVEPSSSWVFNRDIVNKVGFWKHRSEITRSPITNYILRCWRYKVKIHFSTNITCIATAFHHIATTKYAYKYEGQELEKLVDYFKTRKIANQSYLPGLKYYNLIKAKSEFRLNTKSNFKDLILCLLVNDFTALLYYLTGFDFLEYLLRIGHSKNKMQLSKKRTGESNRIIKPQFNEALEIAKKNLA